MALSSYGTSRFIAHMYDTIQYRFFLHQNKFRVRYVKCWGKIGCQMLLCRVREVEQESSQTSLCDVVVLEHPAKGCVPKWWWETCS